MSLIVKFLGDRLLIYILFMGLLISAKLPKVEKASNNKGEEEQKAQNEIKEKLMRFIPRYSDL